MRETIHMHMIEAFRELAGNCPRLIFRNGAREVVLQVTVRHILHGDEDSLRTLEPSIGLDK